MDLLCDDIIKVVLTFIPTPDLCRYRTVCKRWNELISNHDFAINHAKNGRDHASFIVLHYIKITASTIDDYGWCVLDMNARRWYQIVGNTHRHVLSKPVAMDGGLVCQHLKAESNDSISLIVHNPIGNYAKLLPLVPKHKTSLSCPKLSLVFDTIANTFQAFVINHCYNKTMKLNDHRISEEERLQIRNDPLVRVYDSATNEWQSLRNPDWDISDVNYLVSSVIFQGRLVLLFCDDSQPLWTYSLEEKTWDNNQPEWDREICFELDPQLVVSTNRLFCLSPIRDSRIRLEEIKFIPEITVEGVCNFSKAQVLPCPFRRSRYPHELALDHRWVVTIGFGKSSLMVMSYSSLECKVLDVVTSSWNADDLPQNPLGNLRDYGYYEWVGKHMNLLASNWELPD